jgi:protein-L-isoaspartate(D-aspartate) O-methyltransferase
VSSAVERLIGSRDGDQALGEFIIALRTRGFRGSRLLEAVERAPRTEFIAPEHVGFVYRDISLPLPCGQETGRPLAIIEAVAALELEATHRVLEVGTGSGWQTALIATLCAAVASVERWRPLADAADARLQRLGFGNVVVAAEDGEGGLPDAAPFDRIILNAAVADIPRLIAAQLVEGGVLLAPLIDGETQSLMRFRKRRGRLARERLGPANVSSLVPGMGGSL